MRNRTFVTGLLIGLLSLMISPVPALEGAEGTLTLVNTTGDRLDAHPVVVNAEKLTFDPPEDGVVVRTSGGEPVRAQLDDLDGDGSPDDFVLLVNLPPYGRRTYEVSEGDAGPANVGRFENGVLENRALRVAPGESPEVIHREHTEPWIDGIGYTWHNGWQYEARSGNERRLVARGPARIVVGRTGVLSKGDRRFRIDDRRVLYHKKERLDHEIALTNETDRTLELNALKKYNVWMAGPLAENPQNALFTPPRCQRKRFLETNRSHQLWLNRDTGVGIGLVQHQVPGWLRVMHRGNGGSQFKLRRFADWKPGKRFKGSSPGHEPVVLEPGESFRSRISYLYYRGEANDVAPRYRSNVHRVTGVVSVYDEKGRIVRAANSPPYLNETFDQNTGRWFPIGSGASLQVKNGRGELRASTPGEGMSTVLNRDFRDPTELRGRIASLTDAGELRVVVRDLATDRVHEVGTFRHDFRVDLDKALHLKKKRAIELRLSLTQREDGPENEGNLRAVLEQIALEWPRPERPEVRAPMRGQNVSDVACAFVLNAVTEENSDGLYQVQLARTEDFEQVVQQYEAQPYISFQKRSVSGLTRIIPDPPPEPGRYFWRYRAFSVAGEPISWSAPRELTITSSEEKQKPLVRPITADNPAFISKFQAEHHFRPLWEAWPGWMRKHAVIELHVSQLPGAEELDGWMREMPEFPMVLRYHKRASLSQLEHLFQNYPRVIGFYFGEKGFERDQMKRGLRLASKYGRYIGFLQGWPGHLMMPGGEENLDLVQKYGKYLLPIVKSNNVNEPLLRYLTAAGQHLSGRTRQWGTETEWGNAFKPYGLGGGRKSKQEIEERGGTKAVDWMAPMIVGLALGAPAYRVEGFTNAHPMHAWNKGWKGAPNHQFGSLWYNALRPFYRDIVKRGLIPSAGEVRDRTAVALGTRPGHASGYKRGRKTTFPDRIVGALHGLNVENRNRGSFFRNEWLPDRTPYGLVPVLPPDPTETERAHFAEVVFPGQFDGPGDALQYYDSRYEKQTSEAPAMLVGDTGVIFNGWDMRKQARTQNYRLSLTQGPVSSVQGKVRYRDYLLLKQNEGELFVHANGYPELPIEADSGRFSTRRTIRFHADERLKVRAEPADALIEQLWNAQEESLRVEIDHAGGVVRLFVTQ